MKLKNLDIALTSADLRRTAGGWSVYPVSSLEPLIRTSIAENTDNTPGSPVSGWDITKNQKP